MGTVHWAVTAYQNLEDIGDYITIDSPFYAISFVEKILLEAERLSIFPKLGRVVPEFKNENIRELIFHNYRIVYKLINNEVIIVSISHGSMDLVKKSKREKWEI